MGGVGGPDPLVCVSGGPRRSIRLACTRPRIRVVENNQVGTAAVWAIYNLIAARICDPIAKMLSWFGEGKLAIDAVRVLV